MRCDELKLVFIDICKNAGTAITQSFQKAFPEMKFSGKHHSVTNRVMKQMRQHECVPEEVMNTYRVFTVIRNPFDRVVSLYLWTLKQEAHVSRNFTQFVHGLKQWRDWNFRMFRSQKEWLFDDTGKLRVTHILRYENLQTELDTLTNRWKLPRIKLVYSNRGGPRALYQSFYTPETRAIVEDLYADDFKEWGYSF